jgi:hypothetical protein
MGGQGGGLMMAAGETQWPDEGGGAILAGEGSGDPLIYLDLRLSDGTHYAEIDHVGQVVTMDLYMLIRDVVATPPLSTFEAFGYTTGSIISSDGGLQGDLMFDPYNAYYGTGDPEEWGQHGYWANTDFGFARNRVAYDAASQEGRITPYDPPNAYPPPRGVPAPLTLDGDADKDIGPDPGLSDGAGKTAQYFFASSADGRAKTSDGYEMIDGVKYQKYLIAGAIEFTVNEQTLAEGLSTLVKYVPALKPTADSQGFWSDGVLYYLAGDNPDVGVGNGTVEGVTLQAVIP